MQKTCRKSPTSAVSVFPTAVLGNPMVFQDPEVGKTLKMPMSAIFGTFFFASYRPPSGNLSSDSCRRGHKLRNEWSYIKIG